jgi:hypothetical protein
MNDMIRCLQESQGNCDSGGMPPVAIGVRSLVVLTCECSETCIMAMHVVGQDDLISIAQFDLDQHQNISSLQT